jgi:putative membrane protein
LSERLPLALAAAVVAALVASGISPYDRATWWLEVLPAMIALAALVATRRSYPLTLLLYLLIAAHCLVLIYGGAYTYARVPLGFWLQDVLGTQRNPYDKIGHFMQGFVPAMIAREILLRGGHVRAGKMAAFLCVCVALAVSAVYELVEWWAALAMGQGADEFLGTQGDEWDTQSDMLLALIGSCSALAAFSRLHDRQLAALSAPGALRSASTG